jgi:hypothetical protein
MIQVGAPKTRGRRQLHTNRGAIVRAFADLFKVSVIGQHVSCGRRTSAVAAISRIAADVVELARMQDAHHRKGVLAQPIVDAEAAVEAAVEAAAEQRPGLPDRKALKLAARAIQVGFGLSMFGFDLVRSREQDVFFIVDLNYFPSFVDVPFQEKEIIALCRQTARLE